MCMRKIPEWYCQFWKIHEGKSLFYGPYSLFYFPIHVRSLLMTSLNIVNVWSHAKSTCDLCSWGVIRWGHSHMSVDIKCLSITPVFYADPTPMTPFFPLLSQILHKNCKFFRASRAFWEFANFALKLHFCTLNDPHFWESTPKKPPFFWRPHRMIPFFRRNLTLNAPYFRSPVGTCTSLSYLSAQPGWHLWFKLNCHWLYSQLLKITVFSQYCRLSWESSVSVNVCW